MQLRAHPCLNYRGTPSWPPPWTRTKDDRVLTITGEVGVSIYVHSNPLQSRKCFLVINHEGLDYVGTLVFEDRENCRKVIDLLRMNLNRPIKEIGDLNVSW